MSVEVQNQIYASLALLRISKSTHLYRGEKEDVDILQFRAIRGALVVLGSQEMVCIDPFPWSVKIMGLPARHNCTIDVVSL